MANYDIGDALHRIELLLLASMRRNLHRHIREEQDEGFRWSMWQAEQLTAIGSWTRRNYRQYAPQFTKINQAAIGLLQQSAERAALVEEDLILRTGVQRAAGFFNAPEDKLSALTNAVRHDLSQAEHSILRQADDLYRQTLFDAHMYLQTGSGTLNNAIDTAVQDLMQRGIRSVTYRNGHRVEASVYARMALRSANVRAKLTGDGAARDKFGVHTVLVSPSGIACEQCAPWLGKVLVDDVYCSGTAQEAAEMKLPLLSDAIRQGFLHPQCNCAVHTYLPGVSKPPPPVTEQDRRDAVKRYKLTQQQRYNERQIRRWKYAEDAAPGEAAKKAAHAKVKAWQQQNQALCDAHPDELRRDYQREKIWNAPKQPVVPDCIEKGEKLSMAASANDPLILEKTQPIPHTKEELDDLVRYAAERDLNLVEPQSFDGDLELAKEQFDEISAMKREYKIQKKLSIKFDEMHDGDLGETMPGGKTIYLNRFAYRDRSVTNFYLNADSYLSSTDTIGIGVHEMGHVISAYYGEKGLDIARQAYYNIYKREITYQELLEFLRKHISGYCVFLPENKAQKPFSVKLFKEVTPEILAMNKTNPNAFTQEFVRLLTEVSGQ